MIRKGKEGERPRWGLTYYTYKKRPDALTLMLHWRFVLHVNRGAFVYDIDLRRHHLMYRPDDMERGLVCRRCKSQGSLDLFKSWCGGKRYFRRIKW